MKRSADAGVPEPKRVDAGQIAWSSAYALSSKHDTLPYAEDVIDFAEAGESSVIYYAPRKWIETVFLLVNRLDAEYPGLADALIDKVIYRWILPEFFRLTLGADEDVDCYSSMYDYLEEDDLQLCEGCQAPTRAQLEQQVSPILDKWCSENDVAIGIRHIKNEYEINTEDIE